MMRQIAKRKLQRLKGRVKKLARSNYGLTGQNPSVGCVLLSVDGIILAEGVTGAGGRPHAEEIALEKLAVAGRISELTGGTAIVSLEPCRQRSSEKAQSCSTRLVEAKIKYVYILALDAHPLGAGGAEILHKSGICVCHYGERSCRKYVGKVMHSA